MTQKPLPSKAKSSLPRPTNQVDHAEHGIRPFYSWSWLCTSLETACDTGNEIRSDPLDRISSSAVVRSGRPNLSSSLLLSRFAISSRRRFASLGSVLEFGVVFILLDDLLGDFNLGRTRIRSATFTMSLRTQRLISSDPDRVN
jgi:hypothetical protein